MADPVVEALIKDVVGVFLHGEGRVLQESKVLHLGGIVQVDQDTGALALFGLEDGLQKTG